MIGIGLDLCQVERMERLLQKGDAFLRRYFAPEEQAYIKQRGNMAAQSMAAMFAAKEAFAKALGVGIANGVELTDIVVLHEESGRPYYALTGTAALRLETLGGSRVQLSLTHEAGMAAAVALIE